MKHDEFESLFSNCVVFTEGSVTQKAFDGWPKMAHGPAL